MREIFVDAGGTNTRFIVGLRGVWTSSEKRRWKKRLAALTPNVEVLSDIELAHRRAFGKKPGIVLNAGTGSIAYGKYRGRSARSGGVGPLLGDEGSAFWIGREYLRRTKKDDWKFLRGVAVGKNPAAKIASYAVRALKDPRFKSTIEQAQKDLLKLIQAVSAELKAREKLPLVLQGGLFSNRRFHSAFMRRVRRV